MSSSCKVHHIYRSPAHLALVFRQPSLRSGSLGVCTLPPQIVWDCWTQDVAAHSVSQNLGPNPLQPWGGGRQELLAPRGQRRGFRHRAWRLTSCHMQGMARRAGCDPHHLSGNEVLATISCLFGHDGLSGRLVHGFTISESCTVLWRPCNTKQHSVSHYV